MPDDHRPEEESAPPPASPKERRPIDVMYDFFREVAAHHGNHPRLEALLDELKAKL